MKFFGVNVVKRNRNSAYQSKQQMRFNSHTYMYKYIEIYLPNNFGNESRYEIQIEVSDTTYSTRFIISTKTLNNL
jgi:hypothetical protein